MQNLGHGPRRLDRVQQQRADLLSLPPPQESLDVSQPLTTSGRPNETVDARTGERSHGHEGQAAG
jgi:hypothetical protein